MLISFFRQDHFDFAVTSEVLPGVDRSFASVSDVAEEASLRGIFAGVHFRSDFTSDRRLGRAVADFVLDNFLARIHEGDDSDDR